MNEIKKELKNIWCIIKKLKNSNTNNINNIKTIGIGDSTNIDDYIIPGNYIAGQNLSSIIGTSASGFVFTNGVGIIDIIGNYQNSLTGSSNPNSWYLKVELIADVVPTLENYSIIIQTIYFDWSGETYKKSRMIWINNTGINIIKNWT